MPLTLFPSTTEPDTGAAVPDLELGLSPVLRQELLDPAAWHEGLEKYARAMHLAVALVDADGQLLGACLNPQPLWSLCHGRQGPAAGACPFALAPHKSCTCVADALGQSAVVKARDRSGLVHFAVPLVLDGNRLGALVAGQVFDKYPEQLPLESIARSLGLSTAKVLEKARREHLVSPATLRVYQDLFATLAHTFLQNRYHGLREASRLAHLRRAQEALRSTNDELERRVEERTAALREAQAKALQAERLAVVGQMVTVLAHEGRNALQRIQGGLTRLGFRLEGQPEALLLVESIQKAEDDLLRLFDEIREFATPIRLEPLACNLADVWREAWADLRLVREAGQAELTEEADDVDLECLASPFHLKQVFRNLLQNAMSVARGPLRIVIRCSETDIAGRDAVRVSVFDNDPGFTAEQRRQAFEPFFTTKPKGTGLGLPICKRIMEAHGGSIEVAPGDGPGAEIVLTLPRRMA